VWEGVNIVAASVIMSQSTLMELLKKNVIIAAKNFVFAGVILMFIVQESVF
jgi:hypothetical protein